jgi:fructose-1,6-bisphosphatase II / sedoheptulose-1,7-bisphosphatase
MVPPTAAPLCGLNNNMALPLGTRIPAVLDRSIVLELVRVTEAAALAASDWMGRGDKESADQAAVDAMRRALNELDISGRVVIGEGEIDEAPMLYIGEKLGRGGVELDIAVDPLEGTTLTAKGGDNALAVIAAAEGGKFLHAPDVYMDKLVVGPGMDVASFTLDMPVADVVAMAARQKGVPVRDLVVCMLDKPRQQDLIEAVRKAGARLRLIPDGDVSGAIACAVPDSGVDLLLGRGGAPEGVLAAAALRCLGGGMLGRLHFRNDEERTRAHALGLTDLTRTYTTTDLAGGEVVFAATGVTNGAFLQGVRRVPGGVMTDSVVMRSATGTVRWVKTRHRRAP